MNMHINYDRIEIPENKLVGYLLNKNHSVGVHKAKYFESLGYNSENWQILRDALFEHVETAENIDFVENQFGMKVVIINNLNGHNNRVAKIKSIWFIENNENILKFVTAYPEK